MYSAKFAPGYLQVAGFRRADGDDDGFVFSFQPLGGNILSYFATSHEAYPLSFENLAPAVDEGLLELETRNAVPEKSANVFTALVDGDDKSAAAERHCGGKTRRACADHGDGLSVFLFRRTRHDPAVRERRLDDALLRLADHDGLVVKAVYAARFAERRTDAGSKFREIRVCGQKPVRPLPVALGYGAVLVGHEVPEGTRVGVAKRLAAVHAAECLPLEFFVLKQTLDLAPVMGAHLGRTVDVVNTLHIRGNIAQPVPRAYHPLTSHKFLQFVKFRLIAMLQTCNTPCRFSHQLP